MPRISTSSNKTTTPYYTDHHRCSVCVRPFSKVQPYNTHDKCHITLSDMKKVRRELDHIKYDLDELKRQQTSSTYCISHSCYSTKSPSIFGPIPSHYPMLYSASNSRPTTTYEDSYNRYWLPSTSVPWICHPIQAARSGILQELQKQYPSMSPAVEIRPDWSSSSIKNDYPYRRWILGPYYSEP